MIKRILPFLSLIALILFLTACGATMLPPTSNAIISTPITDNTANTTPATSAIGSFREYPLPKAGSGLMRPAIDHKGRLWFGEMGHNFLTVFDPRTQTFEQMIPPHGAAGVMGVVVAADDTIWFAEQYADYIGHYFPARKQFQVYDLPTLKVPDPGNPNNTLTLPSAPNDLALDAHGNVWFTELNADALGMLDVTSSIVRQYPLSSKKSVQVLNPYGVAVDPQGMVWFTEATTDSIGLLDPNTGTIRFYTLPGSVHPLMEVASDIHGSIWATSFSAGLLVRLDPHTRTFTQYYAPAPGNAGGLYGLLVTPDNEVWITNPAANVIAQLDVASNRFMYYHIPTGSSLPLGLAAGTDHTLWFTEAGSDKIGMLKP
jgi:virginiamycin B lyase